MANIYHQDGTNLGVEVIVSAIRTHKGQLALAYKSPKSGARGLMVFRPEEAKIIFDSLGKPTVSDEKLKQL